MPIQHGLTNAAARSVEAMSRRLRLKIWLGVALMLLLVSTFAAWTIRQDRANDMAHAADISRAVATSLEDQATATLRDVSNGLYSAVNAVSAEGGLPLMTPEGLKYTMQREFTTTEVLTDIGVLDAEGRVYTHMTDKPLVSESYPNNSQLRYFREHPDDNRVLISPPLTGPTYQRWLLPISVPLRSYDKHLEGVIIALLDLGYFQRFYAAVGGQQHWQYTITDLQGGLVTHYPDHGHIAPRQPFLADLPARLQPRENRTFEAPNPVDGRPFLYTAHRFATQPLVMYVGIDVEQHLTAWRQRSLEKLAMLVLLAIILFGAAKLLVRAFKRSAHDTQVINAIFKAAGDGIYIGRNATILACNPAAARILGAQCEAELVGLASRELWPEYQPDGQLSLEKAPRMYAAAIDAQGSHIFEWALRRLDGVEFISEVHMTTFTVEDAQYHLSVIRDITERKQAEREIRLLNQDLESRVLARTEQLTLAKRELEIANEELRAFSYTVAHDIRAPVRHVLGFANMALSDKDPAAMNGEVRESIERIIGATTRMSDMIESLLALGRVGQKALADTEFDLGLLAQSTISTLRDRAPQRQVECHVTTGCVVRADPTLMQMVLENLLSNAWKFTGKKEHAVIEFGHGEDENGYYFFVRDNGAGFDPQYAGRMFEPFSRLHGREEFEGTGVGLATVRRILSRHGGEIRAESRVGEGATFIFTLGARDARVYRNAEQGSPA